MSDTRQTVQVEKIDGSPAIVMRWEQDVVPTHVQAAFSRISQLLSESSEPLSVIVDIRTNPNFPLSSTITGAIFGPFRDPKLKEWLVIGSNPIAHIIERILTKATGRSNIKWFDNMAEVNEYLQYADDKQSFDASA